MSCPRGFPSYVSESTIPFCSTPCEMSLSVVQQGNLLVVRQQQAEITGLCVRDGTAWGCLQG